MKLNLFTMTGIIFSKKNAFIAIFVALTACSGNESYFVSEKNVEKQPNLPVKEDAPTEWSGIKVDGCNMKPAEGELIEIDQDDTINIYGWAIDDKAKAPIGNIYLIAGNKYIKGKYGLIRDDVKAAMGISETSALGYSIMFDRNLLKDDKGEFIKEIGFATTDKGNTLLTIHKNYGLVYSTQIPENTENAGKRLNLVIEACNGKPAGDTIDIANADKIELLGWGGDTEAKQSLQKMFVNIGEKSFKVEYGTPRDDVKNFLGANTNEFGYNITLPRHVFLRPDGTVIPTITLTATTYDGKFSAPVTYQVKAE